MSQRLEELETAAWRQVVELLRQTLKASCQNLRRVHSKLSEEDHQEIQARMEGLLEKTLSRVEPELGELQRKLLVYPDEAVEGFSELFFRHFRECALELEEERPRDEYGMDLEAAMEEALAEARKHLSITMEATRAVKEAMEKDDYDRAEQIIRGRLAVNPDDVAMLNRLFDIGCFSGNPALVAEAIQTAKSRDGFQIFPESVNRDTVNTFLREAVMEQVLVSVNPLAQPGLLLGPGLSQLQEDDLRETVDLIGSQVVEEIIIRLAGPDEWDGESLVAMCREVISAKCQAYGRWLPGRSFIPYWKGEELPEWVKARVRQM